MKNKIQLLQFVTILIFSFGSYAQVTVSVSNLQYTNNGQATVLLANCGNIDLASSTTTSINLEINLSKPNGQVVGLSDLRVYTKTSSSESRIERSWAQITEISWSPNSPSTRSTSASFSINSSDFNASGGTLFVVFKSSGNIEYTSTCIFTITKTPLPSFTLSPTTLNLTCGDTNSRVFAVTPANIPSGANVTYQWSYSGWSLVSSTETSRTLQPISANPGSVIVTPSINNTQQLSKTCSVSLAPFTSPATITGQTGICSGSANYTISLTGGQNVSWSLSNPSIGALSNQTNTGTTVSFSGNGAQTLIASITNQCGQGPVTKSFLINNGSPAFTTTADFTGLASFCAGSSTYTMTNLASGQNVAWSLSAPGAATLSSSSNSQTTVNFTGNWSQQTLTAVITNSCGATATISKIITLGRPIPIFSDNTTTYPQGAAADYGYNGFGNLSNSSFSQNINLSASLGITNGLLGVEFEVFDNSTSTFVPRTALYDAITITTADAYQIEDMAYITIRAKVQSDCGWSDWAEMQFTSYVEYLRSAQTTYLVYPNPATTTINIDLADETKVAVKKGLICPTIC
jgi:hypothetical protein